MAVAKRKRREKPTENRTKEGPRTRMRPQVKQTALLASPIYIGQDRGRRKYHIKRGAKIKRRQQWWWGGWASLPFVSFESTCLHIWRMYSPLLSK